ncbi:MAG: hypothetical protein IAG13_06645 [Deltaproteobacteria bacterium]|nr:hypothetical protein [Nannocystaceae bacterium]
MTHSRFVPAALLAASMISSCTDDSSSDDAADSSSTVTMSSVTGSESTAVADSSAGEEEDTGEKLDSMIETGGQTGCGIDTNCTAIDVVFVIDNSGTMGEEQLNLAANFPLLIEQLQTLTDAGGNMVTPSVNIMVTTTDFGHPLCTPFEKPDYSPRRGAPVYEGCNARINRFTGLDPSDPLIINEACTVNCPVDVAPGDQFLHFDSQATNVPSGDAAKALSCIGPQGIDGCGYEAQLETMLQAINPEACWNNPTSEECEADLEWGPFDTPFLRDGALLAIVIVSDEAEGSVAAPNGFSYFTNDMNTEYWEVNPNSGTPQPSSAIVWNAGVTCTGPDASGQYSQCVSAVNDVLHPTKRYIDYLKYVAEVDEKEVIMLGILGVPEVTQHNAEPPYEPTMGGVFALDYRTWSEDDVPAEEAMQGVEVEDKVWEFGDIAPGCQNDRGLAIFPTRVQEVCESLNVEDNPDTEENEREVHCCIESICSTDFSPAIRCLTGAISSIIPPAG